MAARISKSRRSQVSGAAVTPAVEPKGGVALARGADPSATLSLDRGDLSADARAALAELTSEITELRQALDQSRRRIAELEALADIDPLVPVLNRRAFVRELARVMSFAERYEAQASLLYFDLDNLKATNDRFGHEAGDAALRHVARLLTAHVRVSDAVGRLGGDEFGVILAKADLDLAVQKGDSLATLLETTPLIWQDQAITLAASYGVYIFRRGQDPNQAIALADRAMYEQKNARKNSRLPLT